MQNQDRVLSMVKIMMKIKVKVKAKAKVKTEDSLILFQNQDCIITILYHFGQIFHILLQIFFNLLYLFPKRRNDL